MNIREEFKKEFKTNSGVPAFDAEIDKITEKIYDWFLERCVPKEEIEKFLTMFPDDEFGRVNISRKGLLTFIQNYGK